MQEIEGSLWAGVCNELEKTFTGLRYGQLETLACHLKLTEIYIPMNIENVRFSRDFLNLKMS